MDDMIAEGPGSIAEGARVTPEKEGQRRRSSTSAATHAVLLRGATRVEKLA